MGVNRCPQALWNASGPHESSNPAFFEAQFANTVSGCFFPLSTSLLISGSSVWVFPKSAVSLFNSFLSFAGLPVWKFMSLIEVSGADLSVIHLMSSHSGQEQWLLSVTCWFSLAASLGCLYPVGSAVFVPIKDPLKHCQVSRARADCGRNCWASVTGEATAPSQMFLLLFLLSLLLLGFLLHARQGDSE